MWVRQLLIITMTMIDEQFVVGQLLVLGQKKPPRALKCGFVCL